MSLYTQTTPADAYNAAVATCAPQTISQAAIRYKINRAIYLGLPILSRGQGGAPPSRISQAPISLRAKLAARGTNVVADLTGSAALKAFIEAQAAIAIVALGGASAILPTGEWSFLLSDMVNGVYTMPSLPFKILVTNGQIQEIPLNAMPVPTNAITVTISVETDGSATVAYADQSGNAISPDPM